MAWIEKTAHGLRLCDRYEGYDGKLHKVSVSLAKDTAQARRTAQIELQNRIADKCLNDDKMTLNRLLERYINQKDIKPSSRINYESAFSQILLIMGDVKISVLTAPYARRRLSESNKAQSTINRYSSLLNGLLEWAYQFGYIFARIHLAPFKEKAKKRDASMEYLEADELRSVLDQLSGTMPGYLCHFLALTGCRIGEAAALTWSDIDGEYIHITKAYKPENGVSTPKTAHSVRDVYIQPELAAFLKDFKEWRNLHLLASGIRTDLLFFSRFGHPYTSSNLWRMLKDIDCQKHLHPHIFRHTHTALLAEQGASLEAIARRLGHGDSKITRQIYFHVTERMKENDKIMLSKIQIL